MEFINNEANFAEVKKIEFLCRNYQNRDHIIIYNCSLAIISQLRKYLFILSAEYIPEHNALIIIEFDTPRTFTNSIQMLEYILRKAQAAGHTLYAAEYKDNLLTSVIIKNMFLVMGEEHAYVFEKYRHIYFPFKCAPKKRLELAYFLADSLYVSEKDNRSSS